MGSSDLWLPGLSRETHIRAMESNYGSEATWWVQATAGVNYVRAELPARYLPGKIVVLDGNDLQQDSSGEVIVPRQAGEGSIWMFPGNTTRALMMVQLRDLGHKVFVELDDNYTRQPPYQQARSWLNARDKTGEDKHSFEVHKHIVKRVADGVIVSTEALADLYRPMNENVYVCRNAVDPTDWDPNPPHQTDGVLRIGWAGSSSHKYDLADIRLALDWVSRQKDVEIVLMGHGDIVGSLLTLPQVRHIPWSEGLGGYRTGVKQIDVMLCPNRPGDWADCKSDLKALEAAMGGACAVVSKTEPFRPWWNGEAPAYNASTPKDFLDVVKHLVANREEAAQTAQEARRYVLEHRDIRNTVSEWRTALNA